MLKDDADVIVVGGGHSGAEAALACSRMGMLTILFAINLDSIAMMPCNPNIGGASKGHLVREIDALGGEMGKNIDKTFIQRRMLNLAKGPAVHSLRAQADKYEYSKSMKKVLENTYGLHLKQFEITQLCIEDDKIVGVIDESGEIYKAKAVILCTGTYLNSNCMYGDTVIKNGPNGLRCSTKLANFLKELGVPMYRFKTGTPARVDSRTVDYVNMKVQAGEETVPFSFENTKDSILRRQLKCYLTYTTARTKQIVLDNIHKSPMYFGIVKSMGARYCPSIEDKIMRFPDREIHQVFIEPEGRDTNEVYVQGLSTSLPPDVQIELYRSVIGLEHCEIVRPGYAIEYDCIDATVLKPSLEFKYISNLFSAGQLNGTSGYEEAAAQGIIAGINAVLKIRGQEPLILNRSDAYIGVLIDDIVIKGTSEPYRMMTSRAEYRLLLRQDNADMRLTDIGANIGLISCDRYNRFLQKRMNIEQEIIRVKKTNIRPNSIVNAILAELNSSPIDNVYKLDELIKRPELNYQNLSGIDLDRPDVLNDEEKEQVNIQIKYEGYLKKQEQSIEHFRKIENKKIPENINYVSIKGLSKEAVQKLTNIKPLNFGQASRITGVSPADILVLQVYLKKCSRIGSISID